MGEEITGTSGLWVHQESAVIFAESHDIWGFTPEFLFSTEVVPDEWICGRATRNQNTVYIQYGPVHWQMTEASLWITCYPDCPWEEELQWEDAPMIPHVASNYLERVPHMPARRLWGFWQVSSVNPNPQQWMVDNFLPDGFHNEFGPTVLSPQLTFFSDGAVVRISIRVDSAARKGETFENSIMFDCYVNPGVDQTAEEMALETAHWAKWRQTVERSVQCLLAGGES